MNKEIIILIFIPLLSALIGWITNYIAIQSLFRPSKEIKIAGISFQGVIPKRKKKLAKKLAHVIASHLLSTQDLQEIFKTPENISKFEKKFSQKSKEIFLDAIPPLLKGAATPIITAVIDKKGKIIVESIIEALLESFEETIDVEKIIEEKLLAYDITNLDEIIHKIAHNELKHIELLGGVIGFLVGCLQVILFIFLN